jgi:hypothetical protein
MENCCCGNPLRESPVKITVHPCKCAVRMYKGHIKRLDLSPLAHVSPTQYAERKRLGLPLLGDFEKHAYSRWT